MVTLAFIQCFLTLTGCCACMAACFATIQVQLRMQLRPDDLDDLAHNDLRALEYYFVQVRPLALVMARNVPLSALECVLVQILALGCIQTGLLAPPDVATVDDNSRSVMCRRTTFCACVRGQVFVFHLARPAVSQVAQARHRVVIYVTIETRASPSLAHGPWPLCGTIVLWGFPLCGLQGGEGGQGRVPETP